MKTNYLKFFVLIIALGLGAINAQAQVKEVTHDFSAFTSLDVSYDFNVTVIPSDRYSVKITVETALADYVQTYVKSKTLFIAFDEKAVPSEVKKQFRGRTTPTLNAVVYVPSLNIINLSAKSSLTVNSTLVVPSFLLNVTDNAKVAILAVESSSQITVNADKKADITATLDSDDITVNASGSAILNLTQDSKNFGLKSAGSSEINVEGDALVVSVEAAGTTKPKFTGRADKLIVDAAGYSSIDALNLKVSDCEAVMNASSKLYESATATLSLDLTNGATVIYDNEPAFQIVQIKNSSVTKYSEKK